MRNFYYDPPFLACTVMAHSKRYMDCEIGKFILDKLQAIKSYALHEIVDDYIHNTLSYGPSPQDRYKQYLEEVKASSPVYNLPKFVPKDNDFDIKEEKPIIVKQEKKPVNCITYFYNGDQPSICYVKKNAWIPK